MADAVTFSQANQYLSISTPLGTDKLILREISGEERISGLFLYRLNLLASDETISFDSLIGKVATVTIKIGEAQTARYINGIISRFVFTHYDSREKIAYYEAELRPWLWLLTLSGHCQIFQAKSIPDIVEAVCTAAGYTTITKSLTGTYAAEDYRVQYGESDYNFIARLMEEEGIFFFFRHTQSGHNLVLGDDSSAFQTDPVVATLNYFPEVSYATEDESVESIRYEKTVTTKTIGLDSFNFAAPATALHTSADGTAGVGVFNTYSGFYTQSSDGEARAKIMQQAAAAPGELIRGSGKLRSLAAGTKITLAKHPRSALNQEYVLLSVRIEGTRTAYLATFEAFPSANPYRSSGTAVRPRIHSAMTALVVGKAGEEIWVDSYGRIKVQFHWDLVGKSDENSSCWIRVSQGWAGKTFGLTFLPRIGQEVVVSFLEGDPDRPLVTGAVYNGDQTVPYALPDNSTRSTIKTQSSKQGTGKFNELRFEDKIGSEEVYFQAQKDFNGNILNNSSYIIGNCLSYSVTKDYTDTISGNLTSTVTNNVAVTVSKGNETHEVTKGTRGITIGGADTLTDQDAFTHKVAKDYTLTVDGNLSITVTGDVTFKGKSLDFESTSAAVTLKSAADATVQSGTAMTVKSGTAMDIESGAGLNMKSQMAMALASSMGMDLKAQLALTAGGLSSTVKGDASAEVSTSGILTLKGSLAKIN